MNNKARIAAIAFGLLLSFGFLITPAFADTIGPGPSYYPNPTAACSGLPYSNGNGVLDFVYNVFVGVLDLVGGLFTNACS